MEWENTYLAVVGIIIGWALNEFASFFRWKREEKQRLNVLKIETYAEWISGTVENFNRYASQQHTGRSEYRTPLCENRIKLIEKDKKALELIEQIHKSIPDLYSPDYQDLEDLVQSNPDWEWKPFKEKMNELVSHLRKKL
jgi:hypothetical protein